MHEVPAGFANYWPAKITRSYYKPAHVQYSSRSFAPTGAKDWEGNRFSTDLLHLRRKRKGPLEFKVGRTC